MNIIVKFFHELINPHCPHCIELQEREDYIREESIRCRSCESLERQLATVNDLNRELLNKLTKSNEPSAVVSNEVAPRPLRRGPIPFNIIRQQLEQESRTKANAMKNAALPDSVLSNDKTASEVNELEQQVLNAAVSRETSTGVKQ